MFISAVVFSDFILAIHILAVVVAFGATFVYPLLFAAALKVDPTVVPWLLHTMQRIGRFVINPGLTVVVLAGIYLATDLHQWGSFYVQWGIGASLVIGAIEGAFMIPREGRLAVVAQRDLAAAGVPAGGQRLSATWSREFRGGLRRVALGGALLDLIVVVTVFLMATHAGRA